LGYSQRDAQEALREIGSKTKNVNEKVKRALKILGR
jgi:Holliday junction resolvasome RuvABC DNA-binding subunit